MPGTRSKKPAAKKKRSQTPQYDTVLAGEEAVASMSVQDKRLVLSDIRRRYKDTGLIYISDEIRPGLTIGEFSFYHTLASAKKRYEKHQGQKKKSPEEED